MKVTFLLPQYSDHPVGGFKVVFEYANHLSRKGHEVAIVYPRRLKRFALNCAHETPRTRLRRYKVELTYFLKKPKIRWFSLDDKIKLIKAPDLEAPYIPDADVVFATAWQTSEYVSDYPPEKGAKFYLVMDFAPWLGPSIDLERTWRTPLKKIAISNWLAELVLLAGANPEDVMAIPPGIDHARFRLMNHIRGRPKRAIMLYSPRAYKRSQLGVSTLHKCKEIVPDLEASLFGPVRKRPKGLPRWIEYYGAISESQLVKLYNSASICLCSSVAEGFALPPAEAMACGCAVVSTDCGGNRDYALDEKTALVSEPDDLASLVSNALRLLADDELRVRVARGGCERMKDFTWEKSVQMLLEFTGDFL